MVIRSAVDDAIEAVVVVEVENEGSKGVDVGLGAQTRAVGAWMCNVVDEAPRLASLVESDSRVVEMELLLLESVEFVDTMTDGSDGSEDEDEDDDDDTVEVVVTVVVDVASMTACARLSPFLDLVFTIPSNPPERVTPGGECTCLNFHLTAN